MSRYREDGLAYGELPQRWDRDRFERFGGQGPPRGFQEDYRYQERDRPGRRDVAVTDRINTAGPSGRYEERDRFFEEDRYGPQSPPGGRRRRTDRELFGDVDPRELANMALTPYRRKSVTQEDIDIDIRRESGPAPRRPSMYRRQSSLDTHDRRPIPRYEREIIQIPAPDPYRRDDRFGDYDDRRGRYEDESYREVEIRRERSVHRGGGRPKSSKAKSVTTKRSSSSSSSDTVEDNTTVRASRRGGKSRRSASIHESIHESRHGGGESESFNESFNESVHGGATSVSESIHDTTKKFKKGKTRMPKRLVRREAIMDVGYPFDEEQDFFVLRIALEKEQIDEVMRISETYKNGEKTEKRIYKYEDKVDEDGPQEEREEIRRTEWINPPSVAGTRRSRSHAGNRSRRQSRANEEVLEERKTVIEESRSPPPPQPPAAPQFYERRETVVEERETENFSPSRHGSHAGALVVQDREYRSDRDIQAEIYRLEAERKALRFEREADERRDWALKVRERPNHDLELVRPARELITFESRDDSEDRNVLRVEKDRKDEERRQRQRARIVAAAMGTLT